MSCAARICTALLAVLAACGGDTAPATRGEVCDIVVSSVCAKTVECDPDLDADDEATCFTAFRAQCCEEDGTCADETSYTLAVACAEAVEAGPCPVPVDALPEICTGSGL